MSVFFSLDVAAVVASRSVLISRARTAVCSIAVHPAGTCFASGGEDGFVRVHHFDETYFKARPYGDLQAED